jgi:hypothetical protein
MRLDPFIKREVAMAILEAAKVEDSGFAIPVKASVVKSGKGVSSRARQRLRAGRQR